MTGIDSDEHSGQASFMPGPAAAGGTPRKRLDSDSSGGSTETGFRSRPKKSQLERDPGMPASTWRLRSDAWEYLKFAIKRLAISGGDFSMIAADGEVWRSLRSLKTIELYWGGFGQRYVEDIAELLSNGEFDKAHDMITRAVNRLRGTTVPDVAEDDLTEDERAEHKDRQDSRPRFEVLIVDETTEGGRDELHTDLLKLRHSSDQFIYDYVIVPTADDAVAAALTNPNLLACVIRPGFTDRTRQVLSRDLRSAVELAHQGTTDSPTMPMSPLNSVRRVLRLADTLAGLRPELDLYLMAGAHIESLAGALTHRFRRVFRREDQFELHLSLLRRVQHLYDTPFFTAIREHARRPAGVFHALPVSRGGSVVGSKWISDFVDFYGLNLLLAETSATSGELDSLLAPVGTIKKAQSLAARAFGAKRTYFVTNGTSTANKIVHQAVVSPDEVVMVDRNCHKSHHHALMLTGARTAYLEAYPLNDVAFYGAVPLNRIKQLLLDYRAAGRLDEVRMITLTNCTFDGIVYDPEKVMAECLAIKPDLVFLWDEAWFAFARFHPVTRKRTAMVAAERLEATLDTDAHARAYREQRERLFDAETGEPAPDEVWLNESLLPPPDAVLRVYATQSTHKTLTSLRQGSMIHVYDQEFSHGAEDSFHEAYMTHTSTSPNYQILASLDLGRRQVEMEGFALVQKQLDLAMSLASAVSRHPLLKKTFRVLTAADLIPEEYRQTERTMPLRDGLATFWHAWSTDEFVVDPSRITIEISGTGVDGDTFKHDFLMDRYGIQVNKTSRNTVLFMTNIGTSRSAVAYLIEVLVKMAEKFNDPHELQAEYSLDEPAEIMPPLPDFSAFAPEYAAEVLAEDPSRQLPDGDLRTAYYAGLRRWNIEHVLPEELGRRIESGDQPVSAGFVTPYPPGFPVLVPGQVITAEVLDFMSALDTREIHGYDARLGYRVILPKDALESKK
ncbi:aminotransferase class I/II-fold pyridoxal phosphate-dependent enzyme [Brevibacterium sp. UCMA 11754]|uniref:aminotransferase class I/II-fold pyridoxal phosphate-dependent enzyme n=1 Tax=Brevibacterium sp. UCMA 11754 TaxID=2749198 RepID=UPI001F45F793|nr:beta-eliminating lyase-related protein [Brevibacterium sp. UCMA 11754]MCF2570593.1 ornithine decarboxylase [Brevibacterium sp. UCMA 11754]